jgi:hypothetical protein
MSKRKYGRSLLGLLVVAALGVMAFASSAQALTPGFLIAKKAVPSALKATVTGEQDEKTVGTLLIPALKLEVNCTKFTVQEGVIETGTDAKGKLLYEGCTILTSTKEEAAGCEVVTADAGSELKHITATALILPAELKDGSPAILAEKIEAKVLTKQENGCVLPTTTVIKGEACFKITAATNDTTAPLIESNQTIQGECRPREALEGKELVGLTKAEIEAREALKPPTAFLDKLLFGTQEAFIDGKATLSLTGVHNGLTLGVSLQ